LLHVLTALITTISFLAYLALATSISEGNAEALKFEPLGSKEVNISVEGLHGCTTLMAVPITIWGVPPDQEAYSFVGYVRSSNLLIKQLEASSVN
jgi:hypothetical protein